MNTFTIQEFIEISRDLPIIDVRAPAEFGDGHISGAINIPIFSNEERAVVGTKYKQESRDTAIAKALEYIAAKTDHYLDELQKLVTSQEICVYCWRGGFRSEGMGHLFQTTGKKVYRLQGGYKAYRNYVLDSFNTKYKLIVLGGMTGSGKTEILEQIEKTNEQMLDLEGIANHKGSAFGALGQDDQPTTQQFENDLATQLNIFDPQKNIWLEDESRMIGRVKIPDDLFSQIRTTTVIKIEVSKDNRINRLIKDYANFSKDELINSINNISRRLGGLNTKLAIGAIEEEDYYKATDIILDYYDKTYTYGLSKREGQTVLPLQLIGDNQKLNAEKVIGFVKEKFDK
ncbi:MAG: tRNA 2-selenouridine(34) synthase MnmH [Candidatus Cloacimonetes bacterium]|nr:tRNA 2-selenouridine(34) synthase MnmH [Candidatus Cloacimonadota bacterium]